MTIITVKTGGIAADAVTDAKIADDIVGTEHLTANEVDTAALAADAVTGAQLADNAVNSEHYTDGSIDTAHLADGQVTIGKLATAVLTGATDIGAAIVDADLLLIDDGAGGTLRKTTAARIKTYVGGNPITVADQWRLTAAHTGSGFVTANWERIDTDQPGIIGTAMSQSSGVFTFPSTGTYLVMYVIAADADSGNVASINAQISVTPDNNNYSATAASETSAHAGFRGTSTVIALVNVDNTTNVRTKFYVGGSAESFNLNGNTGYTRTGVTFIRIGDST